MRKLVFLFVLFLTVGVVVKAQKQITFKASAPQAVVMGQQFKLVYSINEEVNPRDFRVPELADLKVLMGPTFATSTSVSFDSSGGTSSNVSSVFTFILMAEKEGTFNVPPATLNIKGANYTSNALAIKVLPPDKSGSADSSTESDGGNTSSSKGIASDELFVRMIVSDKNVYEQEGFLVTFKIYSSKYDLNFESIKFPEFEGFLAQEIDLPNKQWVMENYNGRNYNTVVVKQTILYPQRAGKITIDSGKFDAMVRIPSQKRVRSFFDDFFDGYDDVSKTLTTNPVTIDVKPLPSGKPASFSGAVGTFTMTSSISSANVKANEAVTIKVDISGNGNIKLVKNPDVVFPNDFDVYDPKVQINITTTTAGANGNKTIEYMAIPRYAGDFEIPAILFSYFDTKTGTYKTLTSEPYKLHVEKGEGGEGNAPVVSNFSNKENVKYLGKDIRYLKVNDINIVTKNDIFFGSFMYFLCYLIPAILFIVFFIIYRKQVEENSNIALVRTKKANKMAVRRLKNAGKLLKENKKEEFYDEVLRALWGYLSDKLSISQSNLTKDNVDAELTKYGVDTALISEFMDILNTCEFARYAPSQASDAMDKLYELTVDAIGKMENTIKK